MQDLQKAKEKMYEAVIAFSAGKTTITSAVAAYAKTLTKLINKVAKIDETDAKAEIDIPSITAAKVELKKQVALQSEWVNSQIFEYADDEGIDITGYTNYTLSALSGLGDAELDDTARQIHTLATTHATGLVDYGIESADLTAFLQLIADYKTKVDAVPTAEAQSKAAHSDLVTLFEEGDKLVKKLKRVALKFRKTNETFYKELVNLTKFDKPKTTSTGVDGIITANGQPLEGVTVKTTVIKDDKAKEYEAISGADGKFSIDIPGSGGRTLFFSLAGKETKQVAVILVMGSREDIGTVTMSDESGS